MNALPWILVDRVLDYFMCIIAYLKSNSNKENVNYTLKCKTNKVNRIWKKSDVSPPFLDVNASLKDRESIWNNSPLKGFLNSYSRFHFSLFFYIWYLLELWIYWAFHNSVILQVSLCVSIYIWMYSVLIQFRVWPHWFSFVGST